MNSRIPSVSVNKILFLFLFCSFSFASAQELTRNNWYFGNSSNGIRFNRSNNTASNVANQATPFGTGGSSVATDPGNANLLFYSDGANVYDANHGIMPNGNGLTANSAGNQPTAVSAVPGQLGKYFLFTNTANFTAGGTISRSVVDMNLFGNAVFPSPGLGDVESKNVAIPGLPNRSEGMIVVPHSNNTDFWLITHEVNSQNYSATLIDPTGYSGTFNTITTSGVGLTLTVANFAYNAALGKIAVSPQGPSTDALILNFDNTTGAFSFDRYIFNTGLPTVSTQSIYDIEWSTSGQYLYISRYGEAGVNADLLQYDYNNTGVTLASILPNPVFRSYGIQYAPDNAIYHLYQATSGGPFLIGKFTSIDSVASKVVYTDIPFGAANVDATQFPSFLPHEDVTLNVSFTSIGTCQYAPTAFFSVVTPAADSLVWNFGDGAGVARGASPIYTYQTANTFNVSLTAFYQGQTQTTSQPITITAQPLQLQLVQDTTACRSEFPPPRGSASPKLFQVTAKVTGGTPASAIWSNGDTGLTLTPDSAGYYYIVVTDVSGCSVYAGVNVKEYELQDQRANVWYFGNRAGIDFNTLPNPPTPLDDSAMDAPEGTSTISDRNGKLIFYTDGNKVYDRTHTEIATGIGGDPLSAQAALIVPVPGDETLYYIFTTQAIDGTSANELRYSLFDIKPNGGLGAVTQQNILLFAKSTERITANGNWLIAHEYGNNTFRSYPITAAGIGDPVYSSIGSDHTFQNPQTGEGYIKLGARNNVAVALSNPGTSNLVELFTLVDSSGRITNYRKIDLKEPNGQVYGIEFSPGGNKVFATLKGSPAPSSVYEYFLDSLDMPYLRNITPEPAQELGALQIGPDGQIYMAINGSNVLGTIQAVEDTTLNSPVNFSGFTLAAGTNSRLGLPNFTQIISNATGGPDFTFDGICFGTPTRFTGIPTDAIDQFQWFFGVGQGGVPFDAPADTTHLYTATGSYTVIMTITNRCLQQEGSPNLVVQKNVRIAPTPPSPTLPGAAALCSGAITLDANTNNFPGYTYLWSSGDTTKLLTVNQPTLLSVTNTDANGCSSAAQSIIVDNRPQLDLGPDITICEDNNTPALNAFNPGATFAWTINGAPASTSQVQAVDVTTPGVFTYEVTVTDPITTCTTIDSKTYTINVSPSFTMTGINPSACNTIDGSISLQINPSVPTGGPYSYFLTGPGGFNQQDFDQTAPTLVGPLGGQRAGTFSGIVTDQISGCTISQAFGLSDAPFTASALAQAPNCAPVTVRVTTTAVAFPLSYSVLSNSSGAQVIAPTSSVTPVFDMSPLPEDVYTIEISDNNGCIFSVNNVAVTPNAPVPIALTSDVCSPTKTVTASGATGYIWTGPGIIGSANLATIEINPGQGQFTYSVTATSAGQCPNTQDIIVNIDSDVVPTFTQSDACAENVILTASPGGPYTYRWFRGGIFQSSLLGQQISLATTENGANYSVTVVNGINGCSYDSPVLPVNVVGAVTASLTSTPVCDDDLPFTLTASSVATGVSYSWFLDGNVISNESNATLTRTKEGTYRVEISKSVCTASTQIQVIKSPIPVGNLPNRVIICDDPDNNDPTTRQVDLDPGTFSQYNWFKNELTLGYTDQVYTADSEGLYRVDITNSFGCVSPDETEVLSQCIPKLVAPNAFRPTSSLDSNKAFSIFSFFITDNFEVFIYNRWGELVFQSNDRYFKWNGTYNNTGQPLPGGSYAYVIKYVSSFRPELGVQEKRGGVALLK
ncbi:MAG: gliding motility-associated C-terminal domain-containing protein [Cyclobacteriaceae bacterium]|nr:gliding motility-associated C-terminal domain-containing protein [Cyclobacteriaceae bacterium]